MSPTSCNFSHVDATLQKRTEFVFFHEIVSRGLVSVKIPYMALGVSGTQTANLELWIDRDVACKYVRGDMGPDLGLSELGCRCYLTFQCRIDSLLVRG